MKTLLIEYGYLMAAFLAVILFALFQWERFKGLLYQLMLVAKSMAKDMILNSGEEQEEWVIKKAYQILPRWVLVILPESFVRELVQLLYHAMKDYADDGKMNKSL